MSLLAKLAVVAAKAVAKGINATLDAGVASKAAAKEATASYKAERANRARTAEKGEKKV